MFLHCFSTVSPTKTRFRLCVFCQSIYLFGIGKAAGWCLSTSALVGGKITIKIIGILRESLGVSSNHRTVSFLKNLIYQCSLPHRSIKGAEVFPTSTYGVGKFQTACSFNISVENFQCQPVWKERLVFRPKTRKWLIASWWGGRRTIFLKPNCTRIEFKCEFKIDESESL